MEDSTHSSPLASEQTEMNPDKMQQVYNEGYAYGEKHLQEIIDFVGK